jgi:DNA-directed RNA polymerase subunit RPC12/RpoP
MKTKTDSQLIGLRCEHCGQIKAALLGWLKAHDELACDGCNHPIVVRPNDFVDAVKRADAVERRVSA